MARRRKIIKNSEEQRRIRALHRLRVVQVGFICCVVFLIYRISYIKFVNGEEFERKVLQSMTGTEKKLDPLRGNIVDRNSKTIATSTVAYNIILVPKELLAAEAAVRQETYQALAEYSSKSVAEIEKIVNDNPESLYRVLEKKISVDDMEELDAKSLKGIWFERTFIRSYPKSELAAQVVGFYNNENGQYGLEQQYNEYMKGKAGRIFPSLQEGNIVTTEIVKATNGSTVVTTLDEVIQQYVEQAMMKYIKEYQPLNAAAVVMNPNTGEIYSMFSYPYYDPNNYTNLSEQVGKEEWDKLSGADQTKLLNRAWQNFNVQHPYEVGSTFKPLIVSAALEEGYVDENFQFNCVGHAVVADRRISCWKKEGHGHQNLEQVLANSCNPGVIAITQNMPKEVFYDYMKKYGFGELTGIDLPGEAKGQLHSLSGLGPVEKATNTMGQNFTATTMQLLSGFSAIVNGGYLIEPYVVSQVIDPENNVVYENKTEVKRQVISNETSAQMTRMLESVVTQGTGQAAAVTGYRIGGKTGTAEKQPREEGKEIFSFIGYAPLDNPEVIAIVLFDEPTDGTGVPGGAFREIMENVLPYLEIQTDLSVDIPTINMSVVPDIMNTTIYDAVSRLEKEGLVYETIGVGKTVTNQYPVPGTKIPKGASVKIYLETQTPESIIEIPNLVGMTTEEAKVLIGEDFKLKAASGGKIISQVPKAGTKIEKNSEIIVQTIQ